METGGKALDESTEIQSAISNIFKNMEVDRNADDQTFHSNALTKYMKSVCKCLTTDYLIATRLMMILE